MIKRELTVIKVGTGVLTRESDGKLDQPVLVTLVTAMAELMEQGQRIVLVSSGAVGAGVSALRLKKYPVDIATKQACAAVGQARLIRIYENLFTHFGKSVAQILLAASDIKTEERRECILQTLSQLLEHEDIIPVVNENDTVATEELKVGDNDVLSAKVAVLLGARRLIILTSVDGLLNPSNKELITHVDSVAEVLEHAEDSRNKFSVGGMRSKLQAVDYACSHGIETIIANGESPDRLKVIVEGSGVCSRFSPTLS